MDAFCARVFYVRMTIIVHIVIYANNKSNRYNNNNNNNKRANGISSDVRATKMKEWRGEKTSRVNWYAKVINIPLMTICMFFFLRRRFFKPKIKRKVDRFTDVLLLSYAQCNGSCFPSTNSRGAYFFASEN